MSKIEDVLRKAGEARTARRGSGGLAKGLITPGAPVLSNQSASIRSHISRSNVRDEIGRMSETARLSELQLAEYRLISSEMLDNRVANAFRELRTKIIQENGGNNRILMVTGVSGGSGASFVARNLAVAFTFDEARTALLLECNLGSPSSYPNLPPASLGLTDYLARDDIQLESIIHATGMPRFRLVPIGNEREIPREHFTSLKIREMLQSLKDRHPERYIIVDVAPIAESADARILSDLCDRALLVVPYAAVTELQINAATKAIGEKKLLCTVFNNVPQLPPASKDFKEGGLMAKLRHPLGMFKSSGQAGSES